MKYSTKRLSFKALILGSGVLGIGISILAGCGSRSADNSTTPGTAGNVATSQRPRIVVIPKGLAHAFWQSVRRGAEDAGKKFDAQIVWNGPPSEAEVSRQVTIVEDAITKKADGIVLAPIDRVALVSPVNKAAKSRIPIVIFDSDVDTRNRLSFVATDNYQGGVLAARKIGAITGGKGKVGMVPVQPNSQSTGDRERGFTETIAKEFPDITVVNSQYGFSDRAKSLAAAEDMLTAHPDMVAVFGPNESSAVGALNALRNRNLVGKVKLVGFDSANVLVEALKRGDIEALVLQNPYKMGYESVKAIIDYREHRDVPKRIDTGVTVITRDNMNTPENQKLLAVK